MKNSYYIDYILLLKKHHTDIDKDIKELKSQTGFCYLSEYIYDLHESNKENIILFEYFPFNIVKYIIELFISNRIMNDYVYTEVKKYIYKHWNDDNISDIVAEIKNTLVEVTTFTKEEYKDIICNENNPKYNRQKHYIYYIHWLYCFYPLLDNYEDLIIKLINIVFLDDAQDELMDGIFRIESTKLLPFYKKFVLSVKNSSNALNEMPCFNLYCSGTGAYQQHRKILNKLKKDLNYNVYTEPEFINDHC